MRHYIDCYGRCWCIFSWNEEKGSNLRGCKIIRESTLIKAYWILVWVLTSHQLIFRVFRLCACVRRNHFFWGQLLLVCEHRNYQLAWLFLSGILKMFGLLRMMHAPSTSSCLCNVRCLCEFVNVHVLLLSHFWCTICSYHLRLLLGNVWCCVSLEIGTIYYYCVFGTECVMGSDVLHGYQSKYRIL